MVPPYTRALRQRLIGESGGKPHVMATYRVIDPTGNVVDTKEIESADDAHAWFVDQRADNSELGWRMEAQNDQDGTWHFFDDTEGTTQ